jgi:plasmid stabilization system protein ParE
MSEPVGVVWARVAKLDIKDAARWYQREYSPSVANQFLDAVERCVSQAAEHPEAHELVFATLRKALLNDFPYSVYYTFQRRRIKVIAVMHWRRNPLDWQARVR